MERVIPGLTELEWVRRLQAGDAGAFEPLYRLYIDRAVRAAFLITRSQQAAEDAVQEAFIQVLRRIGTLRDPARFRSWFFSILLNAARRRERKGRGWGFLPLDRLRRRADAGAPGPEEQVLAADRVRALRAALRDLPERHRIPLILRYYVGLSEAEIAGALGLPLGTVKSRLHHARLRLLGRVGDIAPDGGMADALR